MVRVGYTKLLWNHAIEFEAYVRLNTSHGLYIFKGKVPETLMSSRNQDISKFCDFLFYDWVMFRDEPIKCPDENPVLGRYLGPAIDVGPEMTSKFTKDNGQVVYRSTYSALTDSEIHNISPIYIRETFDKNMAERYGPNDTTSIGRG